MVRSEVVIGNEEGIHLLVAAKIANVADQFDCIIHLKYKNMDLNAKSIISLVSGAIRKGDTVLCVCDGPDDKKALETMKELLVQNFE